MQLAGDVNRRAVEGVLMGKVGSQEVSVHVRAPDKLNLNLLFRELI